jgi:hypothetical protein
MIWDRTYEVINGERWVSDFREFSISFEPAPSSPFIWMRSEPGAFRPMWDLRIWPINVHYHGKRTR